MAAEGRWGVVIPGIPLELEGPSERGGERGLSEGPPEEVRRVRKGPIARPEHVEALLSTAGKLSREHWEVVVILLKTGIEVEALSRITWRDLSQDKLSWQRPKRGDVVVFPLDDDDLRKAIWGFIRRPRRSADQLDRLVRQARQATNMPELEGVTALSLRLTRCLTLLREGMSVEAAARLLAIKPAIVEGVARDERLRVGAREGSVAKDENGESGVGSAAVEPGHAR